MNYQVIQQHIEEIKKVLESTKNVFVLLPQNPTLDATASALALYLSLKESGKNAVIGSPSDMRVEFSKLVGVDRISDKIGNRNLIISFDYAEDSIEKVSYNVEGNKFNLVVQPKSGFPPLNTKSVNFSYEGINADLIITVGTQKLENLGKLYERERDTFNKATLFNIDRTPTNIKYGQINLVEPKISSISEIVLHLIKSLSLPMNVDIAGNLMQGIQAQTQNFQSPFAGAEAFEAAAELMRAGAKRAPIASQAERQWIPTGPTASPRVTQHTPFSTPLPRQPQQSLRTPFIPTPPQQGPIPLTEPKLDVSDFPSSPQVSHATEMIDSTVIRQQETHNIVPPPPPAQLEAQDKLQKTQDSQAKTQKKPRKNQSAKPGRRV